MSDDSNIPSSKADFFERYQTAWFALKSFIDTLSDEELIEPTDAAGWNVRDHLAHLEAWERTRFALIRKEPEHVIIGLPADLYASTDYDPSNEVIRQQTIDEPADSVLSRLQQTNQQLLEMVEALPDEVLRSPVRDYHPEYAASAPTLTLLRTIHGDAAAHFDEHLPWMQAIVESYKGNP